MQYAKTSGLAVMAVLALSSAFASPAFAEFSEFDANKTGVKLAGKALNTQKFKTGGATVECTKLKVTGETTALKVVSQAVSTTYESCTVLLFGTATVSAADYTFYIPLAVSPIENPIIIKASSFGEECEVEVFPDQALGTGLTTGGKMEIEYENGTSGTGKESIIIKSELEKIRSKILKSTSSTNCGTVGAEVEGTYSGNAEVEAEGAGNNLKLGGEGPKINSVVVGNCTFKETGAKCVVESEVTKVIGAGRQLEVKARAVIAPKIAGVKIFIQAPGAKLPKECKNGLKLGLKGKCEDEVEYVGPKKPGAGALKGFYEIQAEEEVTTLKAIDIAGLTT